MEYNYPLDYTWSTDDILDVVSLYNAVEQAYEKGICKEDFLTAYRRFKKQTDRNLVVTEVRARRFFEPMTEIRKKQKIAARKKILKRLYMLRRYESRF